MRSRTTAALGSITAEHHRAGARRLREGMAGVFGEADRGRLSGLARSAGLDGGEVSPLRPRREHATGLEAVGRMSTGNGWRSVQRKPRRARSRSSAFANVATNRNSIRLVKLTAT